MNRSGESAADVSPVVIRSSVGKPSLLSNPESLLTKTKDEMQAMRPGCIGCNLRGHLCVLCEIQGKDGRTDQILDISDWDEDDFPMAQARANLKRNKEQANKIGSISRRKAWRLILPSVW